jgi:uncharacterized protein YdeI (YjbR/CyaY-like superfamily)
MPLINGGLDVSFLPPKILLWKWRQIFLKKSAHFPELKPPMTNKEIESICPTTKEQWREWLAENHAKKQSVWLIYYRTSSGMPTISWSEAVDEALCFGWIDSKKVSIDELRFKQYFSQRKAKSIWSKINKEKITELIENGLMTKSGLEIVKIAKDNGSWSIMDEVEALIVPQDLEKEFQARPGSMDFYLSLSNSNKKILLAWIVMAKRPETRQKRIVEIAENASQNQKPKQFR